MRSTIRAAAQPVPRIGDAARLFFTPLEPFLVDGRGDHKRIGRIARESLGPIWSWNAAAEAKALSEDINRALLNDNRNRAEQLVRALHERAIQRMRESIAGTGADEKALRRLAIQVGTPRAVPDLTTLLAILALGDPPTDLARRLPTHIAQAPTDAGLTKRISAMRATSSALCGGGGNHARRNRMDGRRTAHRTQGRTSDCVAAQEHSRHGPLLAPGNGSRRRFGNWPRSAPTFPGCSGQRSRRRRAPPPPAAAAASQGNRAGSLLDAIDVNEAEARVQFLGACRNYASELAVNEATMRAHSELSL